MTFKRNDRVRIKEDDLTAEYINEEYLGDCGVILGEITQGVHTIPSITPGAIIYVVKLDNSYKNPVFTNPIATITICGEFLELIGSGY